MLLDPRNSAAYDLPSRPVTHPWAVASTPRTGSTLLCRLLWDTDQVGAPKEYCNPMQVRDWTVRLGTPAERVLFTAFRGPTLPAAGRWWSRRRREAHLSMVRARRTGADGHFGLKLHAHHARAWFGDDLAGLWPVRWVRIRRRDRLGQAISWARALQTGRWASTQTERRAPRFDRRAVARALARIERDDAWWDARLAGAPVLELTYEDLADDPAATVHATLAWLGAARPDAPVGPLPLRRQADAISRAWRAAWTRADGG